MNKNQIILIVIRALLHECLYLQKKIQANYGEEKTLTVITALLYECVDLFERLSKNSTRDIENQ